MLLDLNLHGTMAVPEVSRFAEAGRRVVVYSEHADDATVLAVMERGAYAFLAKQEARDHCVATILAAAPTGRTWRRCAAGTMAADERPDRPALSDRERTALLLWFQSMSKAAVATRMGIAETTVRQYIQRARIKYANAGPAGRDPHPAAGPGHPGRPDPRGRGHRVRLPGQPHALTAAAGTVGA